MLDVSDRAPNHVRSLIVVSTAHLLSRLLSLLSSTTTSLLQIPVPVPAFSVSSRREVSPSWESLPAHQIVSVKTILCLSLFFGLIAVSDPSRFPPQPKSCQVIPPRIPCCESNRLLRDDSFFLLFGLIAASSDSSWSRGNQSPTNRILPLLVWFLVVPGSKKHNNSCSHPSSCSTHLLHKILQRSRKTISDDNAN